MRKRIKVHIFFPSIRKLLTFTLPTLLFLATISPASVRAQTIPRSLWKRHAVDARSRGADGVRLADADGDGKLDIVTGWEEGGVTCIYLHPGEEKVKASWPRVVVGETPSVEDAVFVDLDGDDFLDVVTCCEGKTRRIQFHWAPRDRRNYLNASAWKTEILPASEGIAWMYAIPMQVDGKRGMDLVAGSKSTDAMVGWFQSPEDPRRVERWRWHPMDPCGWIMSLYACDMDEDGDDDILMTDRKGAKSGVRWLENPAPDRTPFGLWWSHPWADSGRQVMFLARGDVNQDGRLDLGWSIRGRPHRVLLSAKAPSHQRELFSIPLPENAGTGKAVAFGDIDLDGDIEIVATCEHADGDRHGVWWHDLPFGEGGKEAKKTSSAKEGTIDAPGYSISGSEGVKYDRIELVDLDADGDLDLLTCEERANLGVIWYENPTVP